jgi:putative transcriptional regulator
MSPTHHPSEELLRAYAMGSGEQALDLAVASHLARCPACQEQVAELEAIGGALLSGLSGIELSEGALTATLARLDEAPPPARARPEAPSWLQGLDLPGPLLDLSAELGPWSTIWPGIRRIELPLTLGDEPVALVGMKAGTEIPEHDHSGLELNLVLAGGFDDVEERSPYLPGDVSLRGPGDLHTVRVHDDGECVVLVVRSGRMIASNLRARLGAWITGM